MRRIRLGAEEIKYMTLFETITGATIKDCVQEDGIVGFLVSSGDMGLAIGKKGINIEKVRKIIGKGIWVMEFSENMTEFVKNLFQPVKIRQVRIRDTNQEKVVVVEVNKRDRKKVIGHDGKRIKIAKKLASRQYNVDDIVINTI